VAKSGKRDIKLANKLAGEALRALRRSIGLTQKQLAARLVASRPGRGGDYTAISKFETGRRPLTWELIVEFCQILDDTPPEAFVSEYEAARLREERRAARQQRADEPPEDAP